MLDENKVSCDLRPVGTILGKEEEQTYSMKGPLQEGGILAMTSAVNFCATSCPSIAATVTFGEGTQIS
jgi:hypothetical protein